VLVVAGRVGIVAERARSDEQPTGAACAVVSSPLLFVTQAVVETPFKVLSAGAWP